MRKVVVSVFAVLIMVGLFAKMGMAQFSTKTDSKGVSQFVYGDKQITNIGFDEGFELDPRVSDYGVRDIIESDNGDVYFTFRIPNGDSDDIVSADIYCFHPDTETYAFVMSDNFDLNGGFGTVPGDPIRIDGKTLDLGEDTPITHDYFYIFSAYSQEDVTENPLTEELIGKLPSPINIDEGKVLFTITDDFEIQGCPDTEGGDECTVGKKDTIYTLKLVDMNSRKQIRVYTFDANKNFVSVN